MENGEARIENGGAWSDHPIPPPPILDLDSSPLTRVIEPQLSTDPLFIVGWLWKGARNIYGPEHANTWARMIHRNLTIPHRFVIFTDFDESEFCRLIEPLPLWDDWRNLVNPAWGVNHPTCYVRLKAFSREFGAVLSPRSLAPIRFVSIDLDCVVLGNLDSLFSRDEDFLIYHRPLTMTPFDTINCYQASMWMMTAGARASVWEQFRGAESVHKARQYLGTDQGWMRHILGPDEPGWDIQDGVYGWPQLRDNYNYRNSPPPGAKIVFFYGKQKPWEIAPIDQPICQHCGHDVQIKPPYEITRNKRGAEDAFQWVPRNYR